MIELKHGDSLIVLRELEENSVDAMVTDPPAGIGFMGKEWDHDHGGRSPWIGRMGAIFEECRRVMKPGAHALVWAIPRTSHWTMTALENAGFEIRDVVTHLFGQGFPKSLDISKAIDKAAGAEREVTGPQLRPDGSFRTNTEKSDGSSFSSGSNDKMATAPFTDAAKEWQGWGTALKPAAEFWILARKPISEKNVSANVLKWGTGGINIDASRIGFKNAEDKAAAAAAAQRASQDQNKGRHGYGDFNNGPASLAPYLEQLDKGRFPANLVLSHTPYCTDDQCDIECAIKMLDEQSGTLKSGTPGTRQKEWSGYQTGLKKLNKESGFGDSGGASRFFYCAKISPSERNAGLENSPDKVLAFSGGASAAATRGEEYDNGDGGMNRTRVVKNHHPTVKPIKLMRYFCRMVTPPGGVILDPFMGSGSTGIAAVKEGFRFVGIEREAEYLEIAQKRIEHAQEVTV